MITSSARTPAAPARVGATSRRFSDTDQADLILSLWSAWTGSNAIAKRLGVPTHVVTNTIRAGVALGRVVRRHADPAWIDRRNLRAAERKLPAVEVRA